MLFKEFIEPDLGHVSYIIADDTKEAMIVDPRRDIDEYDEYIKKHNLNLKYILNTHTHADYIGGHLELVNKYEKAKNIFHKDVLSEFEFIKVKENDSFKLGKISIKILETPGHTPYCISAIVSEDGVEKYIFTGDILFVGDIARPDLLGKELLDDLLNMSYNTANKLWNLKDDLIVFTSHIKGSLCGKNLKNQYFSTIGIEKQTNYSFKLSQKSKSEYIDNLKNQNLDTPLFFRKMAKINIVGPKLLNDIKKPEYISYKELMDGFNPKEDFIIDFRHPNCFKQYHIPGSINVYEFANIILIVGSLIDNDSRVFLAGSKQTDFDNIIKKLQRIGFDNIVGILNEDVNEIKGLSKFKDNTNLPQKIINLDTSKNNGDINIEISQIKNYNFDKTFRYKVVCENGYKSIAVESYLKRYENE